MERARARRRRRRTGFGARASARSGARIDRAREGGRPARARGSRAVARPVAARRRRVERERAHAARAPRAAPAVRGGVRRSARIITPRTVIGARFMKAGRMYFFETGGVDDVDVKAVVLVRTELAEGAARGADRAAGSPRG